jgi:hypothetical protein
MPPDLIIESYYHYRSIGFLSGYPLQHDKVAIKNLEPQKAAAGDCETTVKLCAPVPRPRSKIAPVRVNGSSS